MLTESCCLEKGRRWAGERAQQNFWAVTACEIGDTLIKRLVIQLTGKPLQRDAGQGTASDLVHCFELLSGKRRFYVFVLFFACVFDQPLIGLKTILGWAVVTLLFHTGRAAHHLNHHLNHHSKRIDDTPSSKE